MTGQAYILSLKESGDNSIVIVGGTNQATMGDLDESWRKAIAEAEILLLQREVPQEMNILAAKYARAHNCKVILDMGGQDTPLTRELLENVDVISPN